MMQERIKQIFFYFSFKFNLEIMVTETKIYLKRSEMTSFLLFILISSY